MANFFIGLYLYFRNHKLLFWLFLLVASGMILFFASRIRLEEDISGVSGRSRKSGLSEEVVSRYRFPDKMIISISFANNTQKLDPDALCTFARWFIDSIKTQFDSTYISKIQGEIPDTMASFYMEYIYNHLPFYLSETDYTRIDSMINPPALRKLLEKDYRVLISPAGFAVRGAILKDPLGIGFMALNKLKELKPDEHYTLKQGFLFTADMKHLLIFITPANPINETSRNGKLVKGIDRILNQLSFQSSHSIKGYYFGSVAMAVGNANQLKKDIFLTLGIAILLIFLLLGWYFQSIKIPLLGFLPALFGGGSALAILFLLKGHVSVIALGIGSVILGLIVDYALYLVTQFRKRRSMEAVLQDMSQTIVLCCLTTAGAFLCLIFLNSSVLHDLGWFAALSVTGAALFTLVFLPHFLSKKDIETEEKSRNTFVDRIAGFSFEKRPVLIGIILVLVIVSLFTFSNAGFEKDMMSLNYITDKLRDAEKEIDGITGGSFKNVYIVSAGKTVEEALRNKERTEKEISGLRKKNIISTLSGTGSSLLSDSLQQVKIRMWNEFWNPERKRSLLNDLKTAGKAIKFKDHAFDGFFLLLDRKYAPLDVQGMKQAIALFGKDWITGTKDLVMVSSVAKVKQENKQVVYNYMSDHNGIVVFDKQTLTSRFVDNVRHDFNLLVKLSMIFVTLLLLLSFGRIELAILTSIPMFASWLITLGFMGIAGIRFNIFNIIISSFIFGLGVDYSILMTRALQRKFKYGDDDLSSYKISVFLSATTTLFGVGVLFFAKHPALNSIALISLVGIVSVVLIAYTIQPLLAEWFIFKPLKRGSFPVTIRILIKTLITWGNIVLVAIILMISGPIIKYLLPLPKKKKQYLFHWIFSTLSRAYIFVTFPTHRKIINHTGEDFSKPAIIIANHQSLIETPAMLRLYPKILILTTKWVWDSPLFGPVARLASFFNVDDGIDLVLKPLQEKISEGYSILIFPEGHRSTDHRIQRFHRGAFYLAEKLHIDILPVVIFGSGDFLPRGNFWGKPNRLYMKICERVTPGDTRFGTTYSERARLMRRWYTNQYDAFRKEFGTTSYYRRDLLLNYVMKGPILEWYVRIKLMMEKNFILYHKLLPENGEILDIGCGYGYLTFMLWMTAKQRKITGIDYDWEKIEVATNCYSKSNNIRFICEDIMQSSFGMKDGYLLGDLLHYLKPDDQYELLCRCIVNLRAGGVILIRDANAELLKRHAGSKITEFFSTHIRFNKTSDRSMKLYFTSKQQIEKIASEFKLRLEVIDNKKLTSNNFFILQKTH